MFVFTKLLLAHLIAEYPLQTPKIFEWKSKNLGGVILHVSIYLGLALLFTLPEWIKNPSLLLFIFTTFIIHIFIDEGKNIYIRKTGNDDIFAFGVDQLLHIFTLLFYFLIYPYSQISQAGISLIQKSQGIFAYLIGMVLVSYAASIFIFYIRRTFFKDKSSYQRDFKQMLLRTILFILLVQHVWGLGIVFGYFFFSLIKSPKIPFRGFLEINNVLFILGSYLVFLYLGNVPL